MGLIAHVGLVELHYIRSLWERRDRSVSKPVRAGFLEGRLLVAIDNNRLLDLS